MTILQYKLDAFEGPMDLLLHLVGQRKVSIHDVPIYALIEQYLDIMAGLREASLVIEAEFLEMAARLVYIKTAALLPKHGGEEDPAEALRQELLDYRDCQYLAAQLKERARGFGFLARAPLELEPDYSYPFTHRAKDLFAAYLAAVGKGKRRLPPPVEAFSGIISHVIVSVSARCGFIFDRLRLRGRTGLRALLEESDSRSQMVATFLAVLMLVKANRVTAMGSGAGAVIELQPNERKWKELGEI